MWYCYHLGFMGVWDDRMTDWKWPLGRERIAGHCETSDWFGHSSSCDFSA